MKRGRPDHVVVVGGGIAGLSAALRLSQAGSAVTVVEPGRIGGKIQTSMFAGRALDEAADAFLLRVPWALALCHDLEIDGELISPVARRAEVFVDGHRHLLPEGHLLGVPTDVAALAASGLVSPEGLARFEADLTMATQPTDPAAAVDGRPGDDVAIGPYLRGRLGDEVVDHLIDPLIGGINAGDTDRLSLAAVVPQIDAAARSGDPSLIRSAAAQIAAGRSKAAGGGTGASAPIFAAPLGGMARLIDAMVGFMPAVDFRVGRSVSAIEPSGSASNRSWRVVLDDATLIEASAVVVACPAFAAGPLLTEIAPTTAARLSGIEHSSIAMVSFAFERTALGGSSGAGLVADVSGCLVPRDQDTLITAISYGTSKWAQWRNEQRDDVVLRVSAGRFGDDRHLELDDDALVSRMVADLDRVLGVAAAPTDVRVCRWPRSFPQYAPGHLRRVDEIEAELDELRGSGAAIAVAGAALRGVGIPASIHTGEQAAEALGATWPTRRHLLR